MRAHGRLFLALALLAPPAEPQVWKCAGQHGTPVYQDTACPPGRELRNLDTDPATVSVIPSRPVPGTTTRATAPAPVKPRGGTPAPGKKKPPPGDASERRFLHPGMTEGEVLARTGAPDLKSGGGGRKLARWTYMPVPGDPHTVTTVLFDYGRVVEVERKVVK